MSVRMRTEREPRRVSIRKMAKAFEAALVGVMLGLFASYRRIDALL